ncbi:YybH family protein [Arthrobacter sp. MA-N2]|uniref:YybH family protein n=1 Tax=Arthrobacter sp. MA-N2 TaxID=1101188 RepID=UPI0018CC6676|nr:SgcJ/EcaC family oxidoreductase [Arthrobacter sp. MA-N2]
MSEFVEAFNRHDAPALAALFTDEAQFINIYGTVMKNRSGIEEGHAKAFSSRLAPAKLVLRGVERKSVSESVSTLYGTWDLSQPSNGDQTKLVPSGSGILTVVAQCTNAGRWLLAAGSNVRQSAPPS